MGQLGGGLIGTQRSSRPNTFVEPHALIMTHNQVNARMLFLFSLIFDIFFNIFIK